MLDSETPAGEKYIAHQKDTATRIAFATETRFLETASECVADYLFGKRDTIWVAEVKSRELLLERGKKNEFRLYDKKKNKYFSTYLISLHKILDCLAIARLLNAKCFLFVKVIHSDQIIYWELTEAGLDNLETRETTTQKNVNGGSKKETNAFLPMSDMRILLETN